MNNRVIILGAGGHAQELYGLAQACMQRVSGFVDETGSRDELFGLPVYHSIPNSDSFLCGVGNPFVKEQFEIKVDNELCEALIHPTVSMYYECYIEPGVTIGAHCTLTANIKKLNSREGLSARMDKYTNTFLSTIIEEV